MSGHSKWANIKHRKEKGDARKGKMFTKLGREIAVAVKSGGADPEANSKLKDVIAKAKTANMPNDNMAKSIKKAAGEGDGVSYEEITYEGYGPSGIAIIVEAMTDSRNRTAADMRHYFDKYGGNLGTTGCVSFMFSKKGVIIIENDGSMNEDDMMMEALDVGAEDMTSGDGYFEILTAPDDFSKVREALEKKGYTFATAEVGMVPSTAAKLTNEEDLRMMEKLIDMLEDNDDVQNVWHNWEQEE